MMAIASLVPSAVMTIDGLGAATQEPIGYVPPASTKRATISRPQWPDSNDQLSEVPGALQLGAHTPAKGRCT